MSCRGTNLIFLDFVITKGNVFIGHLYNGSSENKHYYFHKGWNIQALIAYICGIALPFPGFVGTLGPSMSAPAMDLGHLGWLLSFTVSFSVYWAICMVWPTRNQALIKEMGLTWEEASTVPVLAEDGTEIIEEGDKVRAVSEGSGSEVGRETYPMQLKV